MNDKHVSSRFNGEPTAVPARLMEMGGLAQAQTRTAVYAMTQFSAEAANKVPEAQARVSAMELELDHCPSSIITRRRPTARDRRWLIAISKTTANPGCADDEAQKIARVLKAIIDKGMDVRHASLDEVESAVR